MSAVLVGSAVLSTSSATAAPKPTIAEVQKKIDRLGEEAEKASEAYNDTREELKSVNVRLKKAHTDLTRQQGELAKIKVALGVLASETTGAARCPRSTWCWATTRTRSWLRPDTGSRSVSGSPPAWPG